METNSFQEKYHIKEGIWSSCFLVGVAVYVTHEKPSF